MKKTFTARGYVKHLAGSCVKGAKDRLVYAQLYLCNQYNLDPSKASECFPMKTFKSVAEQQGKKVFAVVDSYCQRYVHAKAIQGLTALLDKQGFAAYSARKRDKDRAMRGKFLSPTSLETLEKETTLYIIQ